LLVGIAFGIIGFVLIKVLKMKTDGKMSIVMAIYYATLAYKAASAFVLALSEGQTSFWVAFAGACLFIISDTCLAFLYFTPVKRKNVFVTIELSTYYTAQILLAMSVALLK
jgi:cyanate permease